MSLLGDSTTSLQGIDQHVLSLERRDSSKKEWLKERSTDYKTNFFMKNGTLNLYLKSGGGFAKPYKAFLFKEDQDATFDYTLLIKDLLDISEARLPTIVSIPIKSYVETGSKVKFLMLGQGPMATILGSFEVD